MDQTVPVGSVAEFFCRVRGDHEQLRVNGELLRPPPFPQPAGIMYHSTTIDTNPYEGNIIDVNVTIETTVDSNNTVISCAGIDQNPSIVPSTAHLIIQGRFNSTLYLLAYNAGHDYREVVPPFTAPYCVDL